MIKSAILKNPRAALAAACAAVLILASCATRPAEVEPPSGTELVVSGTPALAGSWEGALSVQGISLGFKLRFVESQEGIRGVMDIPQQLAFDLELEAEWRDGTSFGFTLPGPVPFVLKGTIDGATATGSFTQGAASGTFAMTRTHGSTAPVSAGPDTGGISAPPLASLEIAMERPGGILYGTLVRPDIPADTAVLIIPGSGPTDRDGNNPLIAGRNDSLRQLAEALARAGILTLRVDKRGIARSAWPGLKEEELTIDVYAGDAAAWLARLREEPGIRRVAFIGHSEGALVATIAAVEAKPDALVLLAPLSAGMARTLEKQLAGAPKELRDASSAILAEFAAGRPVADVPPALMSLYRPSVQPYMISMLAHDPAAELASLSMPAMVLAGGRDLQIDPADARSLASAREGVRFLELPLMNHVLKTVGPDRDDNMTAYARPEYPLADKLVETIAAFLLGL